MNPRHQDFANAYLSNGGDATAAAIKVGAKAGNHARVMGSRWLKRKDVATYLEERANGAARTAEVDVAYVLERLKLEAEGADQAGARVKSLELLGKHLGMFAEHVEHTGKDGGPVIFQFPPIPGDDEP